MPTVRWAGAQAPLDLAAETPSEHLQTIYMYCIPCPQNVSVYNVTGSDTCIMDTNTNDQHNTQMHMTLYIICVCIIIFCVYTCRKESRMNF